MARIKRFVRAACRFFLASLLACSTYSMEYIETPGITAAISRIKPAESLSAARVKSSPGRNPKAGKAGSFPV